MPVRQVSMSAVESRRSAAESFALVIFGASGDLTQRKLMPALFSLFRQNLLPERIAIVGFARSEKDDQQFIRELRQTVGEKDPQAWEAFASHLHYQVGQYHRPEDYRKLKQRLIELAGQQGQPGNCLFYLATPPEQFASVAERLAAEGLAGRTKVGPGWSRIIIEKPFGHDLESARQLNARLMKVFDETQVFRIDHYLGKETVQNLLVLRFANGIFEPLWNHKYIDHVQMTVAEQLGVGRRGKYYEQAGATRDVLQNHMLTLLALMAMEPPVSLEADAIRDEKVKLLRSLQPIQPECCAYGVVRGQYTGGEVAGEKVIGYRQEKDVAADSASETFVALKLYIDNWRWAGVPFYLRTGKRMAEKVTEVSVHFKAVPNVLFNAPPAGPMQPNVLVIRIQPDEGISMRFQVKAPGSMRKIQPHWMDFCYRDEFGAKPPEAYERLILDAALGDWTLFTRGDEIEAAWRFITPVLEGCDRLKGRDLAEYPAGSWGPDRAEEIVSRDGNRWQVFHSRQCEQSQQDEE